MAVENQYQELFAGTKKSWKFVVEDQDSATVPAPTKDLTGIRLILTLTTIDDDDIPVFTSNVLKKDSDTAGHFDRTGEASGEVIALITSADTASLSGLYHFQLEAIDIDSEGVMLAAGTVLIKGNTSNA